MLLAVATFGQSDTSSESQKSLSSKEEHTQWISSVLRSAQTIKPGMTRKQLLNVFEEEGGLSTRTHKQYVHKDCPYIKVEVEFVAVGDVADNSRENPEDKIVSISKPYLEWSIMD